MSRQGAILIPLLGLMLLGAAGATVADLNEAGKAAYARGDFATAEREAERLLGIGLSDIPGAQVDAHQALAIVRQARGQVTAALDARKMAAEAARRAGSWCPSRPRSAPECRPFRGPIVYSQPPSAT